MPKIRITAHGYLNLFNASFQRVLLCLATKVSGSRSAHLKRWGMAEAKAEAERAPAVGAMVIQETVEAVEIQAMGMATAHPAEVVKIHLTTVVLME